MKPYITFHKPHKLKSVTAIVELTGVFRDGNTIPLDTPRYAYIEVRTDAEISNFNPSDPNYDMVLDDQLKMVIVSYCYELYGVIPNSIKIVPY